MADFLERISALSPERLALLANELKGRLDRVEHRLARQNEPIAVVGISCRLPGGATDPDAYWAMLRDGVDGVREVPAERWDVERLYDPDPDRPGTMSTKWGGFLDGFEDFDPWFFGISPREAMGMDPQQRLLLEVAWEALEHAGISADRMEGTDTGVYVGLCNQDYLALRLERPLADIDSYYASGVASSMAAGRVAYLLGLHGPALTVDTACSSSLVALHLACESLRSGESRTALAAGVSLILGPETMISLSKSRILSPDGKCRTFDASASGIARGEGCAVVVLKRLSDARDDGDRVHAVIRASGTNQDGRSSGITAPNGAAQEALLRATLARAGLEGSQVDYVEAHGTGTSLGDPIEVRALAAAYGNRSDEQPLRIGSVKTNVGHLEAAAGLAGFLKVVVALKNRAIPPHLHLERRNPHVAWDDLPIEIPTELVPWEPSAEGAPRRGAVSSFGFSGTNAHVIVEEAPDSTVPESTNPERSAHLLALSARSPEALQTLAERYATVLEGTSAPLPDICHTAGTGRALFPHRMALVAGEATEAASRLRRWIAGDEAGGVRSGKARSPQTCETVFLFTGQGSQSVGMGRELYASESVFRDALDRCESLFRQERPESLLEIMHAPAEDDPRIHRTEFAQPALFSLEYALSELWKSWGVEPVAVLGHSLGEYVAATVAGLWSLEDGLRLVVRRGQLMQAQPDGGAMAAVFARLDQVGEVLDRYPAELALAAINGTENLVVSGAAPTLDRALEEIASLGFGTRRLVVSHAFHSPLMDPILDSFESLASEVTFEEPHVPIVSNVTGAMAGPHDLSKPRYWRDHIRQPVRFLDGLRSLEDDGYRTFMEIGAHPTLTGLAASALRADDVVLAHSLRRGRGEWEEMLGAAGALHVRGTRIDFEAIDTSWPRATVDVPTAPFERKRFWGGWTRKEMAGPSTDSDPLRDGFWGVEWRDTGLHGAAADPDMIARRLTPRAEDLVVEHGATEYEPGLPLLDDLCRVLIVRALRELGAPLVAGDRLDPGTLRQELGVRDEHGRLFGRMLGILGEDGVLAERAGALTVTETPPDEDPVSVADALGREAPALQAEAELTLRCGLSMHLVLRGEADPLELLFPGGSTDEAAALYADSPSFRVFNTLVRDAVSEVVAAIPDDGRVHVLEVGGGTGGVTRSLLPALPRERTEYLFTDISPLFASRAAERFGEHPGFRTGVFDLTHEPTSQGVQSGAFDVIVASNVLHATPDLRHTLAQLRGLLAPGGMLVVLEGVLPQRFGDLTVGLTDGWWSFTDTDLRPDYALLGPGQWLELLGECGFDAAAAFPDVAPERGGVLAQQRVLLARRASEVAVDPAASWLALTGGGSASEEVVSSLRSSGVDMTPLVVTSEGGGEDIEKAIVAGAFDGVIHLLSLDSPALRGDMKPLDPIRGPFTSALDLVRLLARRGGPRLVIATRGGQAVSAGESVDPGAAPLWGLSRGIVLEHPELRCVCVDLPMEGGVEPLATVLAADPIEDQIAIRGDRVHGARIQRTEVEKELAPIAFSPSASYLVTGGLAGLGLRVARWMAERGAGTVILAGRREPSDEARAAITAIEGLGCRVLTVRGDVADRRSVAEMVSAAGDAPLRGVVHAAGVTDDAPLLSLDWERTRTVMDAKVVGSWNLHLATVDVALDHFVLFSSGAALLGSPGQANHAAANAFLGGLTGHRASVGLPAVAIDWGPWGDIGAATRGDILERARAAGLHPLDPDHGLDALERLMARGGGTTAVLSVDWGTYLDRIPTGTDRPFFESIVAGRSGEGAPSTEGTASRGGASSASGASEPTLSAQVFQARPARRPDVMLDGLRIIAGKVLGAPGDEIDPSRPLTELGLDSLMAVEMRNRVATALETTLPATLLFNYPTLEELADFLMADFTEVEPTPEADEPVPEPAREELNRLDDMSESEVADLLAEKLKDV